MSYLDKVKEELKRAAQEGWSAMKEGAKVAADKSEEVAKTGKLRYRAHILHKQAEKLFANLGGMVYEMAKPPYENPLSNQEVMRLIEEIKGVEKETNEVEEEIERAGTKEEKESAESSEPPKSSEPSEPKEPGKPTEE
ncbi:MAG: hypothetical protein V3W31_08575 [Thermodesulfobacteriota bacterium]